MYGFLLTGLPPFIIQTPGQVGVTAWRTREKRSQRVQQWPVLPVWRPSETIEDEVPLNWRHRVTVTIISLQSAGSLPSSQTNSQKVKCQHVHRRDRRHCQWYTKSLLNFWNDYLILFAANTKHTALLISSSCLPCGNECNVLTDCTVLGDVLCHRNALQ